MAFELSQLIERFEHIPTEAHQYEEKHQAVTAVLLEAAGKLLDSIPYGQEAEDVVSQLVKAGEAAHSAIDKIASTGNVKVGGQVVSPSPDTSGQAVSETPVAAEPPPAPAAPVDPATEAPAETAPPVTDGAV